MLPFYMGNFVYLAVLALVMVGWFKLLVLRRAAYELDLVEYLGVPLCVVTIDLPARLDLLGYREIGLRIAPLMYLIKITQPYRRFDGHQDPDRQLLPPKLPGQLVPSLQQLQQPVSHLPSPLPPNNEPTGQRDHHDLLPTGFPGYIDPVQKPELHPLPSGSLVVQHCDLDLGVGGHR